MPVTAPGSSLGGGVGGGVERGCGQEVTDTEAWVTRAKESVTTERTSCQSPVMSISDCVGRWNR